MSMGENFVGDEHPRLVTLLPFWKQYLFFPISNDLSYSNDSTILLNYL